MHRVGLKAARQYSKKDDVPLTEFRIKMREPIHLHPAFRYGMREWGAMPVFAFEVDLAGEFDLFAWRRQINEFQYYYALHRGWVTGSHDETERNLIQAFLEEEHKGSQSEFDVPGLDSFLPLLTGIYCWDRYKRDHRTLKERVGGSNGFLFAGSRHHASELPRGSETNPSAGCALSVSGSRCLSAKLTVGAPDRVEVNVSGLEADQRGL